MVTDVLTVLHNRVSCPRLTTPAPAGTVLDDICRASLRAADHGNLRPWRFLKVQEDGLDALGTLFVQAALVDDPNLSELQQQRIKDKPKRAPLVLVAIANCEPHPKVPEVEMILATGAAVQNMLNAAYALKVGAYWRTGALSYHPVVAEGLGLEMHEKMIGFIYLGTPAIPLKPVPELDVDDFFKQWPQS